MASVFTKIISGELPCYKIYEDQKVFALLALDQVNLGHTLVVPKQEVNHWFEVEPETFSHLNMVAQKIAKAIQKATECPRVGTIVAGFEVPHYHLHMIPAWSIPDLDFKRAKRCSDEEMKSIQEKILKFLN